MTVPFVFFAFLLLLLVGAYAFLQASPTRVAESLRLAGPIMLGLFGLGLLIAGRAGLGGILLSGAVAWYASNRVRRTQQRTPGKKTSVRTAAIEMDLDHDTGGLSGIVLVGRFEGKQLDDLTLEELLAVHTELAGDAESLQLLETYLDGRFPVWRENSDADGGAGQGATARSGAMTKEEAYEVLGLEAGATAAEIRKAHHRLMQRMHPDMGGSSFLAARINEARDVLLSNGHN